MIAGASRSSAACASAGVGTAPQSTGVSPGLVIAAMQLRLIWGLEARRSRPTRIGSPGSAIPLSIMLWQKASACA